MRYLLPIRVGSELKAHKQKLAVGYVTNSAWVKTLQSQTARELDTRIRKARRQPKELPQPREAAR
jgi:hypothetical protein